MRLTLLLDEAAERGGVLIRFQNRLRVRPLTSNLPVTDPMVYPHLRHRRLIGTELYDYYGFLFKPPSHHIQRYRVA